MRTRVGPWRAVLCGVKGTAPTLEVTDLCCANQGRGRGHQISDRQTSLRPQWSQDR